MKKCVLFIGLLLASLYSSTPVFAQTVIRSEKQRIVFGDWVSPVTSLLFNHLGKMWTFQPEKHDEANLLTGLETWQPTGIFVQTENGIQLGGETDSSDNVGNSLQRVVTSSFPYLEIEYELFTKEADPYFDDPALVVEVNNQLIASVPASTATIQQSDHRSTGIQYLFLDWTDFQNKPTHIKISVGNTEDGDYPSWVEIRRLNFWTIPLHPDDSLLSSVEDLQPQTTIHRFGSSSGVDFIHPFFPWKDGIFKEDFYWHSVDKSFNEEVERSIPLHFQKRPPDVTGLKIEHFEEELFITATFETPLSPNEYPIFIGKSAQQEFNLLPKITLKNQESGLTNTYVFDRTNTPLEISSVSLYVNNISGSKGLAMEKEL